MTPEQITYYNWQEFKFVLAVGVMFGVAVGVWMI